jgi:hypothetical protein
MENKLSFRLRVQILEKPSRLKWATKKEWSSKG